MRIQGENRYSPSVSALLEQVRVIGGTSNYKSLNATQQFVSSSSSNSFAVRLEKHLDDVRKAKGGISKDVGFEIVGKGDETAARLNPKLRTQYLSYLTGLNYEHSSRYINGLEIATRRLETVA